MKVAEILNSVNIGKSVAESDERLDSYFVNTHTFNSLSSAERDIVAGDKGTGKTALYRTLMKRHRVIPSLKNTEMVAAFNLAGSPVFQQLLSVPEQTEGQYVAFWKTYFLTLVGNWMLDSKTSLPSVPYRRVEFFLQQNQLTTVDWSPTNIFRRLLGRFPKTLIPKSVEADISVSAEGTPVFKPRVDFSPPAAVQPPNFFGIDYIAGLRILETSLRESGITVWVTLDRLDEAFLGYPGVEIPALRALLRTYLDMQAVSFIKLKLFLRKDLFRKVTAGGFVNLTHINNRKIEIVWEEKDLLNLLIARVKDSTFVVRALKLRGLTNEEAFARLFPAKISRGEKQSNTWKWMISRIRDGNGVVAPRNLIDLVENCREDQLRSEARNSRDYVPGQPLIEVEAVRKAHQRLSVARVQDTLIAEFAELAPQIELFRKKKAEWNMPSLRELYHATADEAAFTVQSLVEIGLLEQVGSTYKIPMLYRDGLGVTQGKAFS